MRTVILFLTLALALPACGGGDDGPDPSKDRQRLEDDGNPKPPPTKIRIFNFTGKSAEVKKRGLKFRVRDSAGTEDQYGDDEDVFPTDYTMATFPGNNSVLDLSISEPTQGAGKQVEVGSNYRTIQYWVTVKVGSVTETATFTVPNPTSSTNDIKHPDMYISLVPHPSNSKKSYICVEGKYHDGTSYKRAPAMKEITHP